MSETLSHMLASDSFSRDDFLKLRQGALGSKEAWTQLQDACGQLAETVANLRDAAQARDMSLKLGAALLVLGRCEEAVDVLQPLKGRRDGAYLLAKCLEELGRFEEAWAVIGKATEGHADDISLQAEALDLQRSAGEPEQAKRQLERLAKKHDDSAEVHYTLGRCCDDMGDYETALDEYELAAELAPENVKMRFRLAVSLDLRGEDDRAIEIYEQCRTMAPIYPSVLINLGVLYEDREQYAEARDCFKVVLKYDPTHDKARLFLKDAQAALTMYYDEDHEKRTDRRNRVLEIPVTDFELSVRARNCLERMNIRVLGDLVRITEQELLAYKNFGETSLVEIKQMLGQHNLRLGQALEEGGRAFAMLDVPTPEENVVFAKPVSELGLSVRSMKAMERLEIQTIGELCQKSEAELLECRNFGETSLVEIREKLDSLGLSLKQDQEPEQEQEEEDC